MYMFLLSFTINVVRRYPYGWMEKAGGEEEGKEEEKKPPQIKKLKRGAKEWRTVWHGQFLGYSVILNYGEGFFRWSEYYLIPMMEVKARKKRELSAEPVGKTHRCISRYIRALGEKHENSTAFNSIHTSLAPSLSVFLPSPLSVL